MRILFEGKAYNNVGDVKIKKYARNQRKREELQRHYASNLVVFVNDIERYALRNLDKIKSYGGSIMKGIEDSILKNDEDVLNDLLNIWSKYAEEGIGLGLEYLYHDTHTDIVGLDVSDFAKQYIREYGLDKSVVIYGTLKLTLRKRIEQALRQGMDERQMTEYLRDGFDIVKSHAQTIARTETTAAVNGSYSEGVARLGMSKMWITALDEAVREAHLEAEGQTIQPGQKYYVGGEYLAYPGDPNGSASNVINCRCDDAPVDN